MAVDKSLVSGSTTMLVLKLLEVTVETNGHEHIQNILSAFKQNDYQINVMY